MADPHIITLSATSESDLNNLVADYVSRGWTKLGGMWTQVVKPYTFYYQKMVK